MPYLAQSEALCGGAAAAMVLRYWGRGDVQPEDFASLVERDRRGITTARLAAAIESQGFLVEPLRAGKAAIIAEIARGRPVVALVDGGRGRLHYVVVIGWSSGQVLVHDPSLGPHRVRSEASFLRAWGASRGFALVVRPREVPVPAGPVAEAPASRPEGPCDSLVDGAVALGRSPDPESAVPALETANTLCPGDGRALRELAGVRFRQERWDEAADLAQRAVQVDAGDDEAWRLVAASRFLGEERTAALEAWNHIGEPRLDRVRIEGLARTRQDLATTVAGLHARDVLTPDSLALAERRLAQLPSTTGVRVSYRPQTEGRADVVASVGEPGLVDPPPLLLLRLGTDALTRREARLRFNSPTGRGERLELGGRFAEARPAAWARLETPRLLGLPGVVTLSALWDRQAYGSIEGGSSETRRRGALDWSHWQTASLRTDVGMALEQFELPSQHRSAFAGFRGELEWRRGRDRLAIVGDLASWAPLGAGQSFSELGATVAVRSSARPRRLGLSARFDARQATSAAPRALWPGAGTGAGRTWLLRASPLLQHGAIVGEAFGRRLLHATVEAETRGVGMGPARLGVATFVDWARASDGQGTSGAGPSLVAVGAGLRLRLPSANSFRLDVATRPGAGEGAVVSAAWALPWPR